jgi:hypothetical protein
VTYHYSQDGKLTQGDILRHIRVISNIIEAENNGFKFKESNIIVITRNCEIDKSPNSVMVARIARLSSQTARMQNRIREGEVLNAFFLPSDGQFIEESYIDWRTLQPVSVKTLRTLRVQKEYYRCSLNEVLLEACLGGFIEFFTRPEEEEIVQDNSN